MEKISRGMDINKTVKDIAFSFSPEEEFTIADVIAKDVRLSAMDVIAGLSPLCNSWMVWTNGDMSVRSNDKFWLPK